MLKNLVTKEINTDKFQEKVQKIIDKLSDETLNELIPTIILSTLMFCVLICSVLITYKIMPITKYSNLIIFFGAVSFLAYFIRKIKHNEFSKIEKFIFILIAFSCLSLFGSYNMEHAIFGTSTRGEGLLAIIAYYNFALLAMSIKKTKYKKVILGSILVIGLVNIIYGFMQTGIIKQSIIPIKQEWHYARGFNGNSMFIASLLSICYPIMVGLFLKHDNFKQNVIMLFFVVLFTFGVLNTGSMAVFISSILVLIYILIEFIVRFIKKEKNILKQFLKYVGVVIIFIGLTLIYQNTNSNFKSDMKEMNSQAKEVTSSKVKENFGTGRIHIWKESLSKFDDHWLFGIGIDNYSAAFKPPIIDVISNLTVDKAHNEYLQKVVCEGIISGLLYVVFLFIVVIKNIKTKNKYLYACLLGFICYSIQAFFGISVTRVSPILFIVIGLLIGGINGKNKRNSSNI